MLAARRSAEPDHAGSNGRVAVAVDQDETAGNAILFVGIEADRLDRGDIDEGDFVAMQLLGGQVLQRVDVEPIFQLCHHRADRLRAGFEQITPTGKKRGLR